MRTLRFVFGLLEQYLKYYNLHTYLYRPVLVELITGVSVREVGLRVSVILL